MEAQRQLEKQEAKSRLSEQREESESANAAGHNGQATSEQELELLREKEELHAHLLSENKKLKANMSACETNLSGFISEMNALLDQHEVGSLLGQALMP